MRLSCWTKHGFSILFCQNCWKAKASSKVVIIQLMFGLIVWTHFETVPHPIQLSASPLYSTILPNPEHLNCLMASQLFIIMKLSDHEWPRKLLNDCVSQKQILIA